MHRLTSSLPAYACHVTRTWSCDTHSTWRNRVFNRSFRRKDEYLLLYGAGHVTSQISTQLPASKSPGVTGSADKK